jgi:hypothetical protein
VKHVVTPGKAVTKHRDAVGRIQPVELVRVDAGAVPLGTGGKGINDTYVGFVYAAGGDRVHAYIKDLDPKQLSNELVAAVLGRAIGLPIPRPFLAIAAPYDLQLKKAPLFRNERVAFASENAGVPPVTQLCRKISLEAVCKLLKNWSGLYDTIAFDEWIANIDRHTGNILFDGRSRVWLIDHGHCFTGPEWQASHLDPTKSFPNRMVTEWMGRLLDDNDKSSACRNSLAFEGCAKLIDTDEALSASHAINILPQPEIDELSKFVAARAARVAELVYGRMGLPRMAL